MIDNSTISGNSTTGWHGGGMFVTDGVASDHQLDGDRQHLARRAPRVVCSSARSDASSATLELQNTIVAGNSEAQCFLAPFGAGAVAIDSVGNNVFSDGIVQPDRHQRQGRRRRPARARWPTTADRR